MKAIKKKLGIVGFTLILLLALAINLGSVPDINAVIDEDFTKGAHRGSSVKYMENTLEAIKDAVQDDQYEFIEFDVQFTKDKKIVVFHDLSLIRTQKQPEFIENLTYTELAIISKYHVPLYEEVMDIVGNKKRINVEIKSQGIFEEDAKLVDEIVIDLKKREISENVIFSSISGEVVEYINNNHPEFKLGQVFFLMSSTYIHLDSLTKSIYEVVEETGADYLMLYGMNLKNYNSLLKLKPADKTLVFWHFDDSMYVVHATKNDVMW